MATKITKRQIRKDIKKLNHQEKLDYFKQLIGSNISVPERLIAEKEAAAEIRKDSLAFKFKLAPNFVWSKNAFYKRAKEYAYVGMEKEAQLNAQNAFSALNKVKGLRWLSSMNQKQKAEMYQFLNEHTSGEYFIKFAEKQEINSRKASRKKDFAEAIERMEESKDCFGKVGIQKDEVNTTLQQLYNEREGVRADIHSKYQEGTQNGSYQAFLKCAQLTEKWERDAQKELKRYYASALHCAFDSGSLRYVVKESNKSPVGKLVVEHYPHVKQRINDLEMFDRERHQLVRSQQYYEALTIIRKIIELYRNIIAIAASENIELKPAIQQRIAYEKDLEEIQEKLEKLKSDVINIINTGSLDQILGAIPTVKNSIHDNNLLHQLYEKTLDHITDSSSYNKVERILKNDSVGLSTLRKLTQRSENVIHDTAA